MLGPLLFIIHLNNIERPPTNAEVCMYADDIAVQDCAISVAEIELKCQLELEPLHS